MSFVDSIKGFYLSLEDKYYAGLDWLEAKGVPVYAVVDPIESANIPSFPIFLILAVLLAGVIVWLAATAFLPGETTTTVLIVDSASTPLQAVSVLVKIGEASPNTLVSNAEGKIVFTVPGGSVVGLEASKTGFQTKKTSLSPTGAAFSHTLTLESETIGFTKVIRLVNASDNAVFTRPITLRFSCTQDFSFSKEVTSQNGNITVTEIPSDCGILVATVVTSGISLSGTQINLSDDFPTLRLSEEIVPTGSVKVSVKNAQGNAVSGINVRLHKQNGEAVSSIESGATGIVTFERVPIGRYYVRTYDLRNNKYAEFDSSVSGNIRDVLENQTAEFAVTLEERVLGKIKFAVKDAQTSRAVSNALVTLFKNQAELASDRTNANGEIEFSVGDTAPVFSARIDHPEYVVQNRSNLGPSETPAIVLLEPVSTENVQSLEVSVVDSSGEPVENAKVVLKKVDGSVASETLATGFDGRALFSRLELDTYYAFVSKEGFGEANSDTVTISPRELSKVRVTLEIGFGNIEVTVLDSALQPQAGAQVKTIERTSGRTVETSVSGSDGLVRISVRADREVFFEISQSGFAAFTTLAIRPSANATRSITATLVEDISRLEVRLLGLFAGNEQTQDALSAGEKYTARFLLLVPENSDLTEAGVHLRTGKSEDRVNNILESDFLLIGKTASSASTMLRGTSFTPPSGFGEDSAHLTSGDAKWVNLVYARPKGGAYQIEAGIEVRDNAPLGTLLEVSYRGWGKGEAYVRVPVDRVLGERESVPEKQALYAVTSTKLFSVGPSGLCGNGFCSILTIEDTDAALQTSVFDSFPAKPKSDYKLFFTLVNTNVSVASAQMELATEGDGLSFGAYSLVDSSGERFTGSANGLSALSIPMNDFARDGTVFGEAEFSTEKDGTSPLLIRVKSDSAVAFEKTIWIEVAPARDFNLNILPQNIVPFIENDLLFQTSDKNSGEALSNVTIELWNGETRIASGQTDSSGVFAFTLQSPAPNSVFRITAQKTGYRDMEQELRVSDRILSIFPGSVDESLTTAGLFSVEKEFILTNETPMDLSISEIRFSGDFNRLVQGRLAQNYVGTTLTQGVDANVVAILELTEDGKRLRSRTDVTGMMTVFVSDTASGKTWANDIPIRIHIGFGGEVLDAKCLIVSPDSVSLFSAGESRSSEIVIDNKCRAEQNFVGLQLLEAKVSWKDSGNPLGSFVLNPTEGTGNADEDINFSDESTQRVAGSRANFQSGSALSGTFQRLLDLLNPNSENAFELVFAPQSGIASGDGTAVITFRALHPTNTGAQTLTARLEVPMHVNNLTQCIEIRPRTGLLLDSTSPGLGAGIYAQYGYSGMNSQGGINNQGFGRFDYSGAQNYYGGYNNGTLGNGPFGGYGPSPAGSSAISGANPTLVDYPERIQATNYPYAGYSEPFYDTLSPFAQQGGLDYRTSWRGRNNSFQISNNCSVPVEIELSPDPALMVNNAKFSIDPASSSRVEVQSTAFYGTYLIDIAARQTETTNGRAKQIGQLSVEVSPADDPSRFRDCIKLSTTSFKFNDFIQRPVIAKVFNSCYAQGVRLDYDSIAFGNHAYGERQAGFEGGTGLIDGVEVIDLSTRPLGNNRAEQILEFELYKNLEYRSQDGFPLTGSNQGTFYGFRVWATGAFNRVQAPASLVVRYSTPQGIEQRKVFRVTIEDFWNILGSLESPGQYGNPYIHAQACVNPQALDFGPCLTDKDFAGKETYTYAARRVLSVGDNPYGNTAYANAPQTYPNSPFPNASVANPLYSQPYGTQGYSQPYANPNGSVYTSPLGSGTRSSSASSLYQPSTAPTAIAQPYPYYRPPPSVSGSGANIPGTSLPGGAQVNVCGTVDRVFLGNASSGGLFGSGGDTELTIERNGLVFTFSTASSSSPGTFGLTGGTNAIQVRVDKSRAKAGKTEFAEAISAKVHRQTPLQTFDVQIPVKLCVDLSTGGTTPVEDQTPILGPDGKPIGGEAALACEAGTTGTAAYTNAGFHMLLLDWNPTNITDQTCNKTATGETANAAGNKFCDAVQNTISLIKKIGIIQGKLKDQIGKLTENSHSVEVALRKKSNDLDSVKTTEHLFRWATEHVVIKQNSSYSNNSFAGVKNETAAEMAFFVSQKDEILEDALTQSEKDALKNVERFLTMQTLPLTKDNAKVIVEHMNFVLNGIAKDPSIDSNRMLLVFDKDTTADAGMNPFLKALGADEVTLGSEKHLVMTLAEYGYFHQQVSKDCRAKLDSDTAICKIRKVDGTEVTVETAQIEKMLSVKFIVGLQDTTAIKVGDDKFNRVLKDAKLKGLTGETTLSNWYTQFINAPVLLIPDSYSEEFVSDFKTAFGTFGAELGVNAIQKLSFSGTVDKAGAYKEFINANWESPTQPVVVFFAEAPEVLDQTHRATIASNPLFQMPFDVLPNNESGTSYGTATTKPLQLTADRTSHTIGKKFLTLKEGVVTDKGMQEGTLTEVSSSEILFAPSMAFAFATTQQQGVKGILYDLQVNGTGVGPLITWQNGTAGTGTPQQFCKIAGEKQYPFVQATQASGTLYLPAGTSNASLRPICAEKTSTLSATRIEIVNGNATSQNLGSKSIEKTGAAAFELITGPRKVSLKDLIEAIQKEAVCVDNTEAGALVLYWNPAKIKTT